MKLIEAGDNQLSFYLTPTERAVLLELLEAYPCVPPAHARFQAVSQGVDESAEIQQLLEEALAERRDALRRQIRQWIRNPETLQRHGHGWKLQMRPGEWETLLQVLNDVRVGSWISLGSPDPLPEELPKDPERARAMATMELAGWFEMSLLEQLRNHSPGS